MGVVSQCPDCLAPVFYMRTDTDSYVRMDRDLDPAGQVITITVRRPRWNVILAHVLEDGEEPPEGAYRHRLHRCPEVVNG